MDQQASVHFSVKANTSFGQKVLLVGESAALGNWVAYDGVMLCTDSKSYPEWRTEGPVRLPINSQIQYKYAVIHDGSVVWEELLNNRALTVSNANMHIREELGHPHTQILILPIEELNVRSPKLNPVLKKEQDLPDIESLESSKWIFTSMNLPLTVTRSKGDWKFSLYPGMWLPVMYQAALNSGLNFWWIGHPNINVNDPAEQEDLTNKLKARRCIPLFLDPEVLQKQRKFCARVLFPLFHNIIETEPDNMPVYDDEMWQAYRSVNSQFATKIKAHYDNASVWVHDYQLLLLPGLLSHSKPEVNIGLYLHSSFPASEVYKVFKHREELLYSMICCDVIGFHLFEYARNFITCCKRILGVENECISGGLLGLKLYGRNLMIRVRHLGVESSQIMDVAKSSKSQILIENLQTKYSGLRILLGIDPLHRLSGIIHKFKSFGNFLASSRASRHKNLKLVQLVFPVRNSFEEETARHRTELEVLRDEINNMLGREAIELLEFPKISQVKRIAYMTIAEALLNTSLRDGLCLLPFEFIALRSDSTAKIVLSEFAGVSRALGSPHRVNPYDFEQLEEAFDFVAKPSQARNRLKQERDFAYVKNYTATKWAKGFMNDIKYCKKDTSELTFVVHGLVDRIKVIALKRNFKEINEALLMKRYKEAKNRVFFFDVEGTICELYKSHELSTSPGPSSKVLRYLNTLASDAQNTVFIVTGRKREVLERWFSSAPEVGLASEYGSFIKWKGSATWECTYSSSNSWRGPAKEIILGYVERTDGSQIVEKESSVSFMFRDADPDYGSLQAKELTSQLEIVLMHFMDECEISSGLGYIEVKQRGIDKGTTIYKVLERINLWKGPADFVVAVGDDAADEEMFLMLQELKRESYPFTVPSDKLVSITCTIGRKPSEANYYAQDWQRLTMLLKFVCSWTDSSRLFFSHNDLTRFSGRSSTLAISRRKSKHDFIEELDD